MSECYEDKLSIVVVVLLCSFVKSKEALKKKDRVLYWAFVDGKKE
jgi:hypothetical protein